MKIRTQKANDGRDDRERKNTSCNRKTNASMRSSIVLTFLSLPVLEGTHERVILLFEFPILAFVVVIFLRFRVLVFLFSQVFSVCVCMRRACYYIKFYSDSDSDSDSDSATICNSPSSYRQPSGNGQLLSRRYCTQSVWLFLCAYRTA